MRAAVNIAIKAKVSKPARENIYPCRLTIMMLVKQDITENAA